MTERDFAMEAAEVLRRRKYQVVTRQDIDDEFEFVTCNEVANLICPIIAEAQAAARPKVAEEECGGGE